MDPRERTPQKLSRRTALGLGLSTLVAACSPRTPQPSAPLSRNEEAKATAVAKNLPFQEKTQTPNVPSKEFTTSPTPSILDNYLNKVGHINDPAEVQRWQQRGYQRSLNKLPVNEITEQEVKRRTTQTIELMAGSTIPALSEAVAFYRQLEEKGEISLTYHFTLEKLLPNELPTVLSTILVEKNGKSHIEIAISDEFVLNNSNALVFAAVFAHEVKHASNMKKRIKEVENRMPPAMLAQLEKADAQIPKNRVPEEADAFATETTVLIEAYRRGYTMQIPNTMVKNIEAFITYGLSAQDPQWKNYIATTYVDLPRGNY